MTDSKPQTMRTTYWKTNISGRRWDVTWKTKSNTLSPVKKKERKKEKKSVNIVSTVTISLRGYGPSLKIDVKLSPFNWIHLGNSHLLCIALMVLILYNFNCQDEKMNDFFFSFSRNFHLEVFHIRRFSRVSVRRVVKVSKTNSIVNNSVVVLKHMSVKHQICYDLFWLEHHSIRLEPSKKKENDRVYQKLWIYTAVRINAILLERLNLITATTVEQNTKKKKE